jgi:hypothetical protein
MHIVELAHPGGAWGTPVSAKFWIRATHHKWKLLNIDFSEALPIHVELSPAASLSVDLDHSPPSRSSTVEVYPTSVINPASPAWISLLPADQDSASYVATCNGTTHFEFDDIDPGDYSVAVVNRSDSGPTIGFAIGKARVASESNTTIRLSMGPPLTPAPVEFHGTLLFDPAWQESLPILRLWPVDSLPASIGEQTRIVGVDGYCPDENSPNMYRWTFGVIPPGHWSLDVDKWCRFSNFVVGSGDSALIELRIGRPVELNVRVIDDDSDSLADLNQLSYGIGRGTTTCPRDAKSASKRGEFRFLAPPGHVEIRTRSREYYWLRDSVEVEEQSSSITLHARKACGVAVHVTVDGRPARVDSLRASLVGIDDARNNCPFPLETNGVGDLLLVVSTPGRYRISIDPGLGYRSPVSQVVILDRGQFIDFDVKLERSQN